MLHYLFVCCLIISRIEINFAFACIEDEEALQDDLYQAAECSERALTWLTKKLDEARQQYESLEFELNECKEKRVLSGIIADIKGHRFNSVQEELKQFNNFSDVQNIFKYVYDNSANSFHLLVDLAESLTDIDLIYNSVKYLHNISKEFPYEQRNDPLVWIRLVKIMEAGVINQQLVNPQIKASAQDFVNKLYQLIKRYTLKTLEYPIYHDKILNGDGFAGDEEELLDLKKEFEKAVNLTRAIYLLDPSYSESIIEEFLDKSLRRKSNLKVILDTILNYSFIEQRIKGISVLFWKMKNSYQINNNVTFDIAATLYKIHSDSEFKTLRRSMQLEVEGVIENLPACARNIYFLPSVCLWSMIREQYLTAGNSTYNNDNKTRNVYITKDPFPGSHWRVQRIGDNFLISSHTYPNEYLHIVNISDTFENVFTSIPDKNTDIQNKWNIQLNYEYCFIQSTAYNLHLGTSPVLYDGQEIDGIIAGFVHADVPTKTGIYNWYDWKMMKCD